jgi:RNA polymerase sigma factor (sigma-70 family)
MLTVRTDSVLRFIRSLAVADGTARLSDRELLQRFAARRDEPAFAALVRRHGPMVLRVCLQSLHQDQDAEDAFQATFLILSRKAATVQKQESLGSWLYGVAHHVATNLKRNLSRRRSHESRSSSTLQADPLASMSVREGQKILHQELARLPEKYRAPLVLCCLESLTRDEAARQLGWPLAKLKNRLEEARKRLRGRLASRGLTVGGAFAASVLCEHAASAAIPIVLLDSTVKAATTVAAGGAAASVVSAKVAALAEGVVNAMFITKLSVATVLVSGILFVAAAGMLGFHAVAADQPAAPGVKGQEVSRAAPPDTKREPADEKNQLSEQDLKKLLEALQKPDEEVRKAAIEALKQLDQEKVRKALIEALKKPDGEVRKAAIEALKQLEMPNQDASKTKPVARAVALQFVSAFLAESDAAKVLEFFDPDADRKSRGKGTAVEMAKRELEQPRRLHESAKLREIVFFATKEDVAKLAERWPGETMWKRLPGQIDQVKDGVGCLVVSEGPKEGTTGLGAFVFKKVGDNYRIVYTDDN